MSATKQAIRRARVAWRKRVRRGMTGPGFRAHLVHESDIVLTPTDYVEIRP